MEATIFVMNFLATLLVLIGIATVFLSLLSLRVANQYERSVVFRLGKFNRTAGPGLYFVWPFVEWLIKLDLRTITANVEQQEGITRDNVPIKVDAVIWYRIMDPERAVMQVKDV
jgi:regulator of protease activity HflC (stomatin/prohibitin superfamily)